MAMGAAAKVTAGIRAVARGVLSAVARVSLTTDKWSGAWKKDLEVATADRQILLRLMEGRVLEAEAEE